MTKPPHARADYPLGPALDFLERIWRFNQALEKLSSRMEKRLGVTAQQRLLVRCLGKHPGMTAGQLAALLHVDPGTVTAAVKRLELKRLLQRRGDPTDKRKVTLSLTVRARALDRPAQGTVEDAVEQLLRSTPARDIATTVKVLAKLTALLGEQCRDT